MYGGPDQVKQPLNAATQSVLQAGSTFKPFTLAAALESGGSLRSRYSGADDMQFPGVDDPVDNFGDSSYGRIDLVRATENSVNTVYVALNIDVGPQKTVDAAVAAGLPKDTAGLEANISNVLGTASPHVLDMADAYATFAAQGRQAPAYTVRSVTSSVSEVSYRAKVAPKRVFSEDTMADLTHALERVTTSGSGSYAGDNLDRPVAGKTGTSSSNRSAWFAGYTPQMAAVVGIYREKDGSPVSLKGLGGRSEVTGGSFPVRIWTAFMGGALEGAKVEEFPDPVFGGTSNAPEPVAPPTTDEPETPTDTPSPTTSTPPPTTTPPTTPTEQPTEQPTLEPAPTVEPPPEPTVEPPAPTTSEEPQDPPAEPPAEPTATDAGTEPLADAAAADPTVG
jgi:membrane peptidoglycan carboxypeptidase